MKKVLAAFLLCGVMSFLLSGCGLLTDKKEAPHTDETTESVAYVTQETTADITVTTFCETVTTDFTTEVQETTGELTTSATVTTEAVTESTTEYTSQHTVTVTPTYEGSTPLLYKVTDSKGDYLWLFGTIHVGRQDYYPLPDYVNRAFEQSDSIAVEIDVSKFEKNYLSQIVALKKMTYNDKTKIKDHIPEETYNRAVEILKENGKYSEAVDSYKPVLWSNFIDNCAIQSLGADASLGIDRHFISRAKELRKPVLQIESAGQQYSMLGGFSDGLQLLMLQSSVNSYGKPEKAKADLDEMMDLWYEGNEAEFTAYLSRESGNDNEVVAALLEEYNKAMFTDRNKKMTDYAVRKLRRGEKVFICVGTAHIIGDDGMVVRLRNKGYTVELVR